MERKTRTKGTNVVLRFLRACPLAILLLFGLFASSETLPAERRSIIAITDFSGLREDFEFSPVRAVAEMPLNHLGLKVHHHNWDTGDLPDQESVDNSRGALIWFQSDEIIARDAFMSWAIDYMRSGRYIVVAGNLGFAINQKDTPESAALTREFLSELGISYVNTLLDDFEPIEIVHAAPGLTDFEQKLPFILPGVVQIDALGAAATPLLTLADHTGRQSDVIAATKGGGIILGEYAVAAYSELNAGFWLTDPFQMFRRMFRLERMPVPDTTTLAGRRIYYSHIDGDGWNSVSTVADEKGVRTITAEVVLDHVVRAYPGLPVSIGPVTADLDLNLFGSEQSREVARQLFAEDNVELATHTHTHPFDWGFYRPDRYDPSVDFASVAGNKREDSKFDKILEWVAAQAKSSEAKDAQKYVHDIYPRPRAYYDGPFRVEDDLARSIEITESLAPADKKVEIVLWSGNTRPYEDALRFLRERGIENMNGGFTRYDEEYPSITSIAPLTSRVGDELQIYTSMSNEADYTSSWTTRFHGFRQLISTIDATEAPIRLLPINLYYHAYSADRPVGLQALIDILEHVETQKVTPITASHFAKIVRGTDTVRIARVPGGWSISDRVALNTIRFDDVDRASIDIDKSVGLLGLTEHNGSLYLALDPAVSDAFIALSDVPVVARRPYLMDSRWPVEKASFEGDETRFQVRGFGAGRMTWRMPVPCQGRAMVRQDEELLEEVGIQTDDQNRLVLPLSQAPVRGADIQIICEPSGLG